MKSSIFALTLVLSLLLGCGSTNSSTGVQNPHAQEHQNVHNDYIQEEIQKTLEDNTVPAVNERLKKIESDHPKAAFLNEKWKNGVVFYALGNEPSWSININKNNSLLFKYGNNEQYTATSITRLASIDTKSITYRSFNNQGEMIITLSKEKCGDTMSDDSFLYSVSGQIKLKGKKEFDTYKGCGNFVPDPRLDGKWIIVKADSLTIDKLQLMKLPELSIDIYKGLVSGNDGCNLFNGKVEFQDNEIIFGMIAGTMMACPNMDTSSIITRSFVDKKLRFELKENLFFYKGEKEIMMLKRAE
jgi:heat shock protein HslJ/uncharacterized membrane protein